MIRIALIPALLLALAPAAHADTQGVDESSIPDWTGNGELGFASARGNSTTESLNARLNLQYSLEAWTHSVSVSGLRASSEFPSADDDGNVEYSRRNTANRYTFGTNSAYLMDERGTLNASLRHEQDDFGMWKRQQVLALSYGNRLMDSERTTLDLQAGPGYRHAESTREDRTESGLVGRGMLGLKYALTDNTELVNTLLVETGDYNTFAQNDFGLSVSMNDHIALKAGWQARHNSDVDQGRKNTDTLTTMNVVYKFK